MGVFERQSRSWLGKRKIAGTSFICDVQYYIENTTFSLNRPKKVRRGEDIPAKKKRELQKAAILAGWIL